MRKLLLAALGAGSTFLAAAPASAQEGGFALNQYQPTPAGDMFFGVPSPYAAGHLEPPKAYAMFDYSHRPVRTGDTAVVSAQGFMRLDVSWAIFDRLLISADAPLSVIQNGEDPGIDGTTFTTLESPSFGDVRVGLRGRLFGENGSEFQIGAGGYLFIPSGDQQQYTGDGSVRGALHVPVGGRIGRDVAFIYNVAAGVELRASDTSPHAFTYGAGAGVLFADDLVQVGLEFIGATAFGGNTFDLSSTPVRTASAATNAELLLGSKLRFLEGLTIGVSGGPGLGSGVGTPLFRAVGMLGWTPLPPGPPGDGGDEVAVVMDTDDDGIKDDKDACPNEPGEPSLDPAKDGCPPSDRDGDGIMDIDDACPTTSGLANADLTLNGCPADTDGDGFHDGIDACLKIPGDPSEDPSKRGCPADDDGDGIPNKEDACDTAVGDPHDDPTKNGCPPDPDEDGIRYAADACPNEKGPPSDNPEANGCPRFARYNKSENEIIILQRIEFQTYGTALSESVTPNSVKVLREVAQIIKDHPEFTLVEVQGHTDDSGDEDYNVDLSQKRAESIKKWLHDKGGVAEGRLTAKGYGMSQPIADNRTRIGRQKNRRVQFMVRKTDDSKKKKPKKDAGDESK
jgi:outer membrane protein OmpA-like peptidoglycan-associated protein